MQDRVSGRLAHGGQCHPTQVARPSAGMERRILLLWTGAQ